MMQSAPISLMRVRELFSQPERLQSAEFLLREIAERMREKLDLVRIDARSVIDAGCGLGVELAHLGSRFPNANLIGVDASFKMIELATNKEKEVNRALVHLLTKFLPKSFRSDKQPKFICCDFAQLSLPSDFADVLWSNLALHWHPQADMVFQEWRRILRVDGLVMFSCFGPDTLCELRHAFSQVDSGSHVLPFVDMHDYGDMLVQAGFSTPVMDMEKITLRYEAISQLFADVRALGGNPLEKQGKGSLNKTSYRGLLSILEKMREKDGRIPVSFEVIYGHAFKPLPRKLASGESIVQFQARKKIN